MRKLMVILALLLLGLFTLLPVSAQSISQTLYPTNPLRIPIPANATYTLESRIRTFRNTYLAWSGGYCTVAIGTVLPAVQITVGGGRVEHWQVPTTCRPDSGDDHHMIVLNYQTNEVYEFWRVVWNSDGTLSVGGAVPYAMSGDGITDDPNHRSTASGFAHSMGTLLTSALTSCDMTLQQGLTIALPPQLISQGFIAPAVGGEEAGQNNSTGIPMGARFALPRDLDVDSIPNLQSIVRTLLRAARDYGLIVADGSSTSNYSGGRGIASLRIQPGALDVCGANVQNDSILPTIDNQVAAVIAQYGLYRVTFGTSSTPVATPTAVVRATQTPRPTNTPRPSATAIPTIAPTPIIMPTLGSINFTVILDCTLDVGQVIPVCHPR